MPTDVSGNPTPVPTGRIKGPQTFYAGLALIAIGLFALWATSDLSQGTLRAMGPAMLPRFLAICVVICGIALAIVGFIQPSEALEGFSPRGLLLVMIAIFCFAATIRPMAIGSFNTPGLGLAFAGPLAIFIGGYATPEARARELAILALALTSFCMVLFGDLLNLPIPMLPQWMSDMFPASVSNDNRLLSVAGLMAVAAFLIYLTTLGRKSRPIDVADHSGQI